MVVPPSRPVAIIAAAAAVLALPAGASAANIELRETPGPDGSLVDVIDYDDTGGEPNRVSISVSGAFATVTDPAGIINAGGCPRVNPGDRGVVRCRLKHRLHRVDAVLGDGDDSMQIGSDRLGATLRGGNGADVLDGGDAPNLIVGGRGDDRLIGGASADVFDEGRARNGADAIRAGGGLDSVLYDARTRPVRADLGGDRDDGERGERDRIGSDVERLVGGFGRDRLTGNRRANILTGGPAKDRISGRGGPDELSAGAEGSSGSGAPTRDRLYGGSGADTLHGSPGRNVIDAGPGADRILAGPGRDRLLARDRSVDDVGCGRGRDRARLDRNDYFDNRRAASRCEVVFRRGAAVAVPLGVPSARQVERGALARLLRLGCPGDAPAECVGETGLTLGATAITRRTGFRVARGGVAAVGIELTPEGRRLLERHPTLRATQVVTSPDRRGIPRSRMAPVTLIRGIHD